MSDKTVTISIDTLRILDLFAAMAGVMLTGSVSPREARVLLSLNGTNPQDLTRVLDETKELLGLPDATQEQQDKVKSLINTISIIA